MLLSIEIIFRLMARRLGRQRTVVTTIQLQYNVFVFSVNIYRKLRILSAKYLHGSYAIQMQNNRY